MQQPSAPTAPPPPAATSPAVPGQGAARGATAGDATPAPAAYAEQLAGLRVRDRAVRQRLEEATEQRDALAESLRPNENGPGPSPAVTAGIEARIKLIDQRILGLEQERDAIHAAISATRPDLLAQGEATTAAIVNDAMSTGREEGMGAGVAIGIPTGIAFSLLFVALRRRLARRRTPPMAPATSTDRTITQLAAAVEATAIEVERIGESQRYLTQLLLEHPAPAPLATPRAGARAEADTRR